MAEMDCRIDGWSVRFPQEWEMSLDEGRQPPQVIFEVEEEPVTLYLSAWNFHRPETGELADAETVSSIASQAFLQQGLEPAEGFSKYGPDGFVTCAGKGATSDGYQMIACFVCTEGKALSVYIVYEEGVDFEKYLSYLKSVELRE